MATPKKPNAKKKTMRNLSKKPLTAKQAQTVKGGRGPGLQTPNHQGASRYLLNSDLGS
jgi:hypothetical protein